MKNVIYAGTSDNVLVAVDGIVPISKVVRRYNRTGAGSAIDLVGNAVSIRTDAKCRARYNGWARITFAGEVAGNAIFAVYKDGVLIEYAQAVETVVTPETEYHTVTIPFAVLVGCCTTSGITIVNTGAIDTTVLNASILVVED